MLEQNKPEANCSVMCSDVTIMITKEVLVPEGVKITADKNHTVVSGPKGELKKEFKHFFDIKVEVKEEKLTVSSDSERRKIKAMVGTIANHIKNMIRGVTEGFTYKMKIIYAHFPMNVKVEGDRCLINNFLGEKVPRVCKIVGDTKIEIQGQEITLTGINVEDVGQTAANLEKACRTTKFDKRVFSDGIFITEKGV